MERLCIIDHAAHCVYFEDVDESYLQEKYNGEEEAYILDNYTFDGDFSWDYITDIEYIDFNGDCHEIEIEY